MRGVFKGDIGERTMLSIDISVDESPGLLVKAFPFPIFEGGICVNIVPDASKTPKPFRVYSNLTTSALHSDSILTPL